MPTVTGAASFTSHTTQKRIIRYSENVRRKIDEQMKLVYFLCKKKKKKIGTHAPVSWQIL